MRIVTPPYMQSSLTMDDWVGLPKHTYQGISPRQGFARCPHCGGAAHQEVDGITVVWTCLNCGLNKPVRGQYASTV